MKWYVVLAVAVLGLFHNSYLAHALPEKQEQAALNGEACEQTLSSKKYTEVKEEIEKLGPLALDIPTISDGVLRYGKDLKSLAPQFETLSQMERDLIDGKVSPAEIEEQTHRFLEQAADLAKQKLTAFQESGGHSDTKTIRREIEGYRSLLSRAENLARRARHLQTDEGREDLEQIRKSAEPSASSEEKKSDKQSSSKPNTGQQNNQNGLQSESQAGQPGAQGDSKEKNSQGSEQKKDSWKQQGTSSSASNSPKVGSKESQRQGQTSQDEKSGAKQSGQKTQAASQSKQGGDSQGQKPSSQQESNDQNGGSPSSGTSGQGSEKSSSASQAAGSSAGSGSQQQQVQNQQPQPTTTSSAGGHSAGKESAQHDIKSSMSDELNQEENSGSKSQISPAASNNASNKDAATGAKGLIEKAKKWLSNLFGSGKSEAEKKADQSEQHKPGQQNHSQEQENEQSQQEGSEQESGSESHDKNKIKSPTEEEISVVLKDTFSKLWVNALRQFDHSQKLLDALAEYTRLAQNFHRQYPRLDFLKQYAARSQRLFEVLEGTKVNYRSLEDFTLSLVGSIDGGTRIKAFLEFLKEIFTHLKAETTLTSEESAVYDKVLELLAKFSAKSAPTEKELVEAFMKQLVGPLSRAAVKRDFPGSDDSGVNIHGIIQALRSGSLNDLLLMARLKALIRIPRINTLRPLTSLRYDGYRVPINDAEFNLSPAEDLQNRLRIHRDGPPSADVKRLAAEDLLEQGFNEERVHPDPKEKKPRIVDIVLADYSGSMNIGKKDLLETLLMASFMDEGEILVALQQVTRLLYSIRFDADPKPYEKFENIRQTQAGFDKLRQLPFSGKGGTSINKAVLHALDLLLRSQQEASPSSGELRRVNIFLITDGDDNIDVGAIINKRKQLGPKVEVAFNVISLGEGNPDLQRLAQNFEAASQIGYFSYQHLTYEEINQILDPSFRFELLNKLAEIARTDGAINIKTAHILSLKQTLAKLATRSALERVPVAERKDLLRRLKAPQSGDYEQAQNADRIVQPILAVLSSNGVRELKFEKKYQLFNGYIDAAAKEQDVDRNLLLRHIPANTRNSLISAIGFPEEKP